MITPHFLNAKTGQHEPSYSSLNAEEREWLNRQIGHDFYRDQEASAA